MYGQTTNLDVLKSSWVLFSGVPDVQGLSPSQDQLKHCGEVLRSVL